MRKLSFTLFLFLFALSLFGEQQRKYEVATITNVKVHQDSGSDSVSYDVSIKVGGKTYVALYTPPLGEETVKYAAGRELLVQVDKQVIRYNDILGQSHDVPILSQTSANKEPQMPVGW